MMASERATPTTSSDNQRAPSLKKWYAAVGLSIVVAVVLDAMSDITLTIEGDDFILLAVFYVVAQATERLIEPLLLQEAVAPQTDELKANVGEAKTTLAVATRLGDGNAAQLAEDAVKEAQNELTIAQKQRAVIGWALASAFALIVCGLLGLGLIGSVSTVATESDFWKSVFSRVDVVVTGLAVGAGTKPLHDLITRIEKSKDQADPATDAAVPATG
jgi:hypothetical protein